MVQLNIIEKCFNELCTRRPYIIQITTTANKSTRIFAYANIVGDGHFYVLERVLATSLRNTNTKKRRQFNCESIIGSIHQSRRLLMAQSISFAGSSNVKGKVLSFFSSRELIKLFI